MAQNRWVNITLDPNVALKPDSQNHDHLKALGAAAAGDLTLSFDTAKFPTLTLLRSAVTAALQASAPSLKP